MTLFNITQGNPIPGLIRYQRRVRVWHLGKENSYYILYRNKARPKPVAWLEPPLEKNGDGGRGLSQWNTGWTRSRTAFFLLLGLFHVWSRLEPLHLKSRGCRVLV